MWLDAKGCAECGNQIFTSMGYFSTMNSMFAASWPWDQAWLIDVPLRDCKFELKMAIEVCYVEVHTRKVYFPGTIYLFILPKSHFGGHLFKSWRSTIQIQIWKSPESWRFTMALHRILEDSPGWHSGQGPLIPGITKQIRLWKMIRSNTARLFVENFGARLAGIVIWPDCPFFEKQK